MKTVLILYTILFFGQCLAEPVEVPEDEGRGGKVLPIFQVVRFPNDVCVGSTRNGTCYTAEECSSKGGTNDGSCAEGFGVCCKFEEACGSSKSENNTFLIQASATAVTSPCSYTICPCSTNICRIRYDFTTLVLASQVVGTALTDTVASSTALGACVTDSMSIASPSASGSPIICGTNTGYHMVIDQAMGSTECQKVNFNIGGSTTTSRSWTIKVTQYACGDEDKGGPPGCLQYFTGTVGNVASYGFPASITASTATLTHLQNQHYQNCFRREDDYCYICYTPKLEGDGTAAIKMSTYGLSISASATAAQSYVGTQCTLDFIEIPNVITEAQAKATTVIAGPTRLCGMVLAASAAQAISAEATVCSRINPFRLGVYMDGSEYQGGTTGLLNEQKLAPAGIIGFSLYFFQGSC